MNLTDAIIKKEYAVKSIDVNDSELVGFLLTLGCYAGEKITVIKQSKSGCIISIRGAKYSIDSRLARSISIE